jgi:hypothetical protein
MRRLLVTFGVLVLGLPAAGVAASIGANDGTLSVHAARGTFTINARGGVIGSFGRGRVVVTDPVPGDGTGPIVSGDDWSKVRSDTTTVYGGTKVRFRLIGGTFKIVVIGRGVNLSVVGTGRVVLKGEGTDDDGTYSFNGNDYLPVTPDPESFTLNASTP